jgi:hypothetical protein
MKLEFSRQIFENTQISSFMKIGPGVAEMFHADKQMDRKTDVTKLIVACHNSANAPSKAVVLHTIGGM